MCNVDALAAINVEQLVTATDRLLVCGHRKHRQTMDFTREAKAAVAASRARVVADEQTVFVRGNARRPLVGAAAFAAAAWLGVVFACLLV